MTKSLDLREDVPDPVSGFPATSEFLDDGCIAAFLGCDETR